MLIDTKLAPLRKGLLEFVVLRIVGGACFPPLDPAAPGGVEKVPIKL